MEHTLKMSDGANHDSFKVVWAKVENNEDQEAKESIMSKYLFIDQLKLYIIIIYL